MVCTALQVAVRIHCWRRSSREVRQLWISICGLLRRSALGVSQQGSLQRLELLEKLLLFALANLTRKRRKEGKEKSKGML